MSEPKLDPDTAWAKQYVLALGEVTWILAILHPNKSTDGGGVARGYVILLILQALMDKVKDIEKCDKEPVPCHYFDYISGTGAGGSVVTCVSSDRCN